MRVTDSVNEFEACPISKEHVLCRGGRTHPVLRHVDDLWAGHKWLTERRHLAPRRRPRDEPTGRRREDYVPLDLDLRLAADEQREAGLRRARGRTSGPIAGTLS